MRTELAFGVAIQSFEPKDEFSCKVVEIINSELKNG